MSKESSDPAPSVSISEVEGAPPIDALPEIQAHAVDAARAKKGAGDGQDAASESVSNPAPTSAQPSLDNSDISPAGEQWDPAIHETPKRMSTKGSWAKKRGGAKGGRSPGDQISIAKPPKAKTPAAPGVDDQAAAKARADAAKAQAAAEEAKLASSGALCAWSTFAVGKLIAGDVFEPEKGEQEQLSAAYTEYLRSQGVTDIPPGFALLMVVGMIVGKRWNDPTFIAKRKSWMELINGKKGKSDE